MNELINRLFYIIIHFHLLIRLTKDFVIFSTESGYEGLNHTWQYSGNVQQSEKKSSTQEL